MENNNGKVICKSNSFASLTIGKEYKVLGIDENKIIIIDDNGKKNTFYSSRFKHSVLVNSDILPKNL